MVWFGISCDLKIEIGNTFRIRVVESLPVDTGKPPFERVALA